MEGIECSADDTQQAFRNDGEACSVSHLPLRGGRQRRAGARRGRVRIKVMPRLRRWEGVAPSPLSSSSGSTRGSTQPSHAMRERRPWGGIPDPRVEPEDDEGENARG